MDEPVPIRRAAVGCLLIALAVVAVGLLVRPAIFSVAPPRDDSVVTVATAAEALAGPARHDLVLSRSHGWSGERAAGDGRVQVTVILAPTTIGGISAVNAASPGRDDCPVQLGADRLVDCDGRAWTYDGIPIDPADPALERIEVEVVSGSVVLDMTGPADEWRPAAESRLDLSSERLRRPSECVSCAMYRALACVGDVPARASCSPALDLSR